MRVLLHSLFVFILVIDCSCNELMGQQRLTVDSECMQRAMDAKDAFERENPGVIFDPDLRRCARVATQEERKRLEVYERLQEFVPTYDGGGCFFATTGNVGERATVIHVFAGLAEAATFLNALRRDAGYERDELIIHPIAIGHCPALALLSTAHRKPYQRTIRLLELPKWDYVRGESVKLDILNTTKIFKQYLLLVSQTGSVRNISQIIQPDRKRQTVEIPLDLINAPGDYLVVFLSSQKPLLPDHFEEGRRKMFFQPCRRQLPT